MGKKPDFDYIITGAGCAGLSLAMHMMASGQFRRKTVLLVDQKEKKSNDRTWCFWEKHAGIYEEVVYKQWNKLWFHGTGYSAELNIAPYVYKMVRGIDFYNYSLKKITAQPNFKIVYEPVTDVFSDERGTGAIVNGEAVQSSYVFNSILFQKPRLNSREYWLLQHFKGWIIEAGQNAFDAGKATLMDFRTDQERGTAFCYVLPFSSTRALVEYTLFSPQLLKEEEYRQGLHEYISNVLGIASYTVREEEFGVIPMTNFKFPAQQNNIIHIGTAGGQTKASSGYTFNFIQKHSAALVQQLLKTGMPFLPASKRRFHFYDSVLLNILYKNTLRGKDIFTDLFKKNRAPSVLKFLDNESSIQEEIKIISSLPSAPFMKAAIQQVF